MRVKVQSTNSNTQSTWSPWSQPLAFRTEGTVDSTGEGGAGREGKVLHKHCKDWVGFPFIFLHLPWGSLTKDKANEGSAMAHVW